MDKNCNATVTAPNNQVTTARVNPSNGKILTDYFCTIFKKPKHFIQFAEDSPSQQLQLQQQNAFKQKQNSQQPISETDPQNGAAVTGANSQSANPQQSQNSLNNSQQHQIVSKTFRSLG